MKPFNLELAKAGHPVQTRDGRKARIISFDKKGTAYPIVVLMQERGREVTIHVTENGNFYANKEKDDLDLVMAPVKKGGWINIYHTLGYAVDKIFDSEVKARECGEKQEGYIATTKIEWEE